MVRPGGDDVLLGVLFLADRPRDGGNDEMYMREALALALRGTGTASPNPMVGAVVVADGRVVGRGHHPKPGEPHAEIFALREAGPGARGAILYTTLEPCAHTGRTGPCTEAIIAAGIRRTVAAMIDPDPRVSGAGLARLRAAGVETAVGVGEADARRINEAYIKHRTTGLPFVIAKWAMTLDGRIATRTGDARWISNETSRAHAHRVRAACDAVLVGVGTVLRDDPALTARPPLAPDRPRRVVLDSRLRTPLSARVLAQDGVAVVVATTHASPPDARRAFADRGADVLLCDGADGRVDLGRLLRELAARGVLSVLVEGGAAVHGAFLDADAVDKILAYVAPMVVGAGPAPAAGAGVPVMADARRLGPVSMRRFGEDVLIEAYLAPHPGRADVPAARLADAAALGARGPLDGA
ncbi:MAG TPA: bifunctional diaminohydroxyphosphoribosylaminopyrimidine deaminase/5-amino-6-(5-phosphoribosylamino)uracil reductase RibD [bacterium]|nr:bifunctional diaminohydroxyphosphoribosylaminopyrimidine deaminase/5-amino-6-(5-phosphoribosylamino)uracil reductase RibD [bacterium]